MRIIIAAAAVAAFASQAIAADVAKPLTVLQCLTVLKGLSALGCVGEQLDGTCTPDAKQYKLGALRLTTGLNISRLQDLANTVQRAQNGFNSELPPLDPKASDADKVARGNQIQANWNKLIDAECPVQPGHIKASDLKLGDGPDENAIPPSVLGALAPIIDP
jgi:hypothetical protein